jgi:hypothetical protein
MSFVLMAVGRDNTSMTRSTPSPSPSPRTSTDSVVIRPAYPDDAAALERLARLDSRRPLTGPMTVAERDGVLLAARAADGRTIADPFAPTADLVTLLGVHAVQPVRTRRRQVILRRPGTGARKRAALAG